MLKILNSTHRDSQRDLSCSDLFLPMKELNAKMAALQYLVQDFSFETMPQWVSFATTLFCNLRCPHCQTHGTEEVHRISNTKRWPDETLRRLARESLPYAYEFCLTLNGEPLATPYLKERLDELGQYGAKLHVTTNGTLFSKEMLVKLLPFVGTISISIDGATELTCEAIRLGVKFKKLLNNIRLLMRACELLSEKISPDIRLAFTIMTSNVRDMPEIVRLAHVLKIPAVDFYDLVVFYPHLRDEDVKLHKPLYNAYYYRAQEEAKRLNIRVYMPDPFPRVEADANALVGGPDLIVKQLPEDYYETLPSPESFLDHHGIEVKAAEIAASIEQHALNVNTVAGNILNEEMVSQKSDLFKALLERHKSELKELSGRGDEKINYCGNLFDRTFVNSEGDVAPCCIPGRPVLGNINKNTMKEIYNGYLYSDFKREFFSSNVPDCCKGCRYLVPKPRQELLDQISPELEL